MSVYPLRSVLYMPGSNQRAMDKARSLAADAIVFDLEDAVAPDAKDSAREAVLAQLAAGGYGDRRLVVRCNGPTTPWGEADIKALAASEVQTLCLPKVETVAQLQSVHDLLLRFNRSDMALWPMVETPMGVQRVAELAAFEAVDTLVMGTTDLAHELRVPHRADRLGLQYALGRCVVAARAAGIAILDGVSLDIRDEAGFTAVCQQGLALGFDGKTLIHPGQIAAANEVFGVSEEAVEHSRRLLAVWDEAAAAGKGIAVLEGKLVETMHVDEARRTLAIAEHIASSDQGRE